MVGPVLVSQIEKLVGISHRQQAQQRGIHHAKDGGIRTDAEGERDHDRKRKARRFAHLPERMSHAWKEHLHGISGPYKRLLQSMHFVIQTVSKASDSVISRYFHQRLLRLAAFVRNRKSLSANEQSGSCPGWYGGGDGKLKPANRRPHA